MTVKQITMEERNSLCFDCEHCIQTIKGKECLLKEQYISRSNGTGMLVCGNREENED